MYCNIVFMIDIFVISKITQYRYYVIAITDVRSLGLSTKWRTLMIKKTMKVRENTFRKLEDPFENGAAKKYVFYVKVDDVAEGIPMATNPRDQKLTSGVATAIKESLLSNDGYFHLKNRGIVLSAESVHYNNKEKIATIIFSDELSHVKDLISVSSDICSLLKKGEQALSNLERVEKQQDIMKDIYMDSFKGKILENITRYQVVEKGIIDDNKLEPLVQAEDMKVIVSRFEDIQEIFQDEYSATRIADGIRTETQELLTIDGIESVYVVFIKIPLQVFVSTNGWDIDIVAAKKKYNELLLEYKDEIIRQINNKKVLRAHWKKKTIQESYNGECLKEVERLVETIKAADFKKKKKQKEIDELQMKILSSRRLLDGEVKVLLDYLAENAQQVEMSVDNIDDWAYDKNFVGKLSHYVGKATLKIKYQSSNNIGKAIERIKQGHDVAEYKKHEHGYFICWKFDDIYEIYGLPSEQIAIDRDTTCIVVDYYLRNLNSSV